jgi:hypothetical protein
MNIVNQFLDVFRSKPTTKPEPRPEPTLETKSHSYQVVEDKLVPQVASLEGYYSANSVRHEAGNVFKAMQFAEELKSEDNNFPLDCDDREGHVVLPNNKFESHPESGYQLGMGDVQVSGDDQTARTTFVKDSWRAKNPSATLDKENQTLQFTYQVESRPTDKSGAGPKQRVSHGRFTVNSDGQVLLPNATSLKEAEEQAPQKANALRANDILQAANLWNDLAVGLDNGGQDLNKTPGQIVAADVQLRPNDTEKVLSEAFTWGGEFGDDESPLKSFDLEQSSGGLYVTGSSEDGRTHLASLRSERTENDVHIVLDRPEINSVEKVHWNLSDGTLNYEKLKKG